MFGQLQNNFRKLLSTSAIFAVFCAQSAYAETVIGRLIASDWFIIVKEEAGVKTIVHTHVPPSWEYSEPVYFNVDFTDETLGENNLYILAASRPGGQDGFLGGYLNGDNKIETGNTSISVLNSNWNDANPPNLEIVKEITAGELGGTYGSTREAKAIGTFSYGSVEHNSDVAGIWSQQSGNDGSVVAFRIAYDALFDKNTPADSGDGDSGTGSSGATDDEREDMLNHINLLDKNLITAMQDIDDLTEQLSIKTKAAETTLALLQERDATIQVLTTKPAAATTLEALGKQKIEIADLKAEIATLKKTNPKPYNQASLLGAGLGLLGLGGLLGWLAARLKRRKKKLEIGFLFPGSSMLAGPLPPTLKACKPVYDAVGRIGYAQKGKPVGEDKTLGTGILIAPNKILTNHHVFKMSEDLLTDDLNTGIEFFGERDSGKSDFVKIDKTVSPIPLKGFDALIFTLTENVEHRTPVELIDRPAEELKDLEIVVIGYPYRQFPGSDVSESTQEEDPIMGVKRFSEGNIFDHSYGRDKPYGVEAPVRRYIHRRRRIRAICHNASTLPGSSGSAVICKNSGKLIALHFGYDPVFEGEEATNFAIPGEDIAEEILENILKTVTPVTDNKTPIMEVST